MLKKTHLAVGTAAVLAITKPKTLSEMVLAVGIGAVGSLISDIDVGTSEAHKEANIVAALSVGIVAGIAAADYFYHMKIIERIFQNSGLLQILLGVLLAVVVCAIGKEQPHRSFMHSISALVFLCLALSLIGTPIVPYFTIGYVSHILLDLLNRRRVRLFYPLKGGICLGIAHSDGKCNSILCIVGSICFVSEVLIFLWRYLH